MDTRKTHKRWLIGAGAGTLLLVGGVLAGPIAGVAQDDTQATLSEEEAGRIAAEEFPGTTPSHVWLETDDGRAVYEVLLSNGVEVEVDGETGRLLDVESDDDDHDEAGTIEDGATLLPQASITLEEAIAAAQGAAEGAVGEVDLEYVGDRLVFSVEIGEHDVAVDAADGSIIAVDFDD